MKTAKDIQQVILSETGIKTSVKKGSGSMKGYLIFTPMLQDGKYPSIPYDFTKEVKSKLAEFNTELTPVFSTTSHLCVYGIGADKAEFKKERKPKVSEQSKTWGSKNSQMRLDKSARRYAKRMQSGNCAMYY